MKKLALLLALTLLFSASAFAADTLKIAIIDMNQVLQKSPLMLDMNDKLSQKFTPRQDELNSAKKQLQDETDQLSLKGDTMSPDDRNSLQNKIITDKANVATLDASLQRDLIIAKNADLQTFTARFTQVIQKIAKDEKYDLIEQRTNIIFLNDKLDITQKVLQQMTVNPAPAKSQ